MVRFASKGAGRVLKLSTWGDIMAFRIIRNDITKVKADAIVNTANPEVAIGDGVERAIYKAAGEDELLAERAKLGELVPGEVGITPAFNLNAKYIIHVSGPWWVDGSKGEEDLLRSCYEKALKIAVENHCETIAFPLLSTGNYRFPKEIGIQIAVDVFTEFLEENEIEIELVVFEDDSVSISGSIVDEVTCFIDDAYVINAMVLEYDDISQDEDKINRGNEVINRELDDIDRADDNIDHGDVSRGLNICGSASSKGKSVFHRLSSRKQNIIEELRSDFESAKSLELNQMSESVNSLESNQILDFAKSLESQEIPESVKSLNSQQMPGEPKAGEESLDDVLKGIYTESFGKHLQKLINKKGLKNSEVYAAANISKQYFSKLLNGKVNPSKEKMLALAVGLRLNLDETIDFLRIAGYAFSPISQTDEVVKYFITHEDYNVIKIDIVLFDYGLAPLSTA